MSRAGRRAWRERLIEAGLWAPSTILQAGPSRTEDERTRALIAERDAWLRAVGYAGWTREQNRRRASRIAATRRRKDVPAPGGAEKEAHHDRDHAGHQGQRHAVHDLR